MSISEENRIQPQNIKRKSLETLSISSGNLLVIDQFMLANEQFSSKLLLSETDISELAANFGGLIISLEQGDYEVHRDPMLALMAVVPQEKNSEDAAFELSELDLEQQNIPPLGKIFVDTRCLVFCDPSLLQDESSLRKFKKLRDSGKDKEGRDFLRSIGAAVRYGFNRYGDELALGKLDKKVILWPDVFE